MNRHVKSQTMSSRVFNQNTSSAKQAANNGPLIITDRGQPAYVLTTYAEYERLTKPALNSWDALTPSEDLGDIDLDAFIQKRQLEPFSNPFDDFEEDGDA
ncbi:type II toxin-antitoxin system prevent-host-death family antitoxin [uncultured Devosia sp.]|uniref:type II toxin-antitoxin system prevent-host-death family antitoxin n=1 Tax=uncultured Devosia sp. TaxID=211434 RepID=UPI0035CC9B9C